MFKNIKTFEEIQKEKNKYLINQRINEIKDLLIETDYKVLPDYDKDNLEIKLKRQEWREEIRNLINNL
jgi:hypothetical protein